MATIQTEYARGRKTEVPGSPTMDPKDYHAAMKDAEVNLRELEKLKTDIEKGLIEVGTEREKALIATRAELSKARVDLEKAKADGQRGAVDVQVQKMKLLGEKSLMLEKEAPTPEFKKVFGDSIKPRIEDLQRSILGTTDAKTNMTVGGLDALAEGKTPEEIDVMVQDMAKGAMNKLALETVAALNSYETDPVKRGYGAIETIEATAALFDGIAAEAKNPAVRVAVRKLADTYASSVGSVVGEDVRATMQDRKDRAMAIDRALFEENPKFGISGTEAAKYIQAATDALPAGEPIEDIVAKARQARQQGMGDMAEIEKQQAEIRERQVELRETQEAALDPMTRMVRVYEKGLGPGFNDFVDAMGFPGDQRLRKEQAVRWLSQNPQALEVVHGIIQSTPQAIGNPGYMQEALRAGGIRTSRIARGVDVNLRKGATNVQKSAGGLVTVGAPVAKDRLGTALEGVRQDAAQAEAAAADSQTAPTSTVDGGDSPKGPSAMPSRTVPTMGEFYAQDAAKKKDIAQALAEEFRKKHIARAT